MTFTPTARNCLSLLFALALVALPAYPQVTLTGAIQFSTNSSGAFAGNQSWNTLGGDPAWDLWLAQNPDASSPINGPSDAQAGISISLSAGNSYQFYVFGAPDTSISLNGLNLFFDGDNSTPGISVFGATNSTLFRPNSSSGTRTLSGGVVTGSGRANYAAAGVVAVLTGYTRNSPATPPGDVCQSFAFVPGGGVSFFGSFTLQVFPAATLSLSLPRAPPGTNLTLTGIGFAPMEKVNIYAGHLGPPRLSTTITDASGAFSIGSFLPQAPYGPEDIYAVGLSSGKLGAASISVTPRLVVSPHIAAPGSTATVEGLGFGAGEAVTVYWANPRQLLGTANTNGAGSFAGSGALTITIPVNAPPGTNAITAVGQTTKAIAIGEVTVN